MQWACGNKISEDGDAQTQTSSTSEVRVHTMSQSAASTTQDGAAQETTQTTDAYMHGLLTQLTRGQFAGQNWSCK